MPAFLRWLNDVTVKDRALVGGKAAALGTLLRAGYSVPDGFCITSVAFVHFRSRRCFPPKLLQEIRDAYRALTSDKAKVAVRSSGTAEDSPMASFAGQYETRLDVGDEDDLLAAILQCWDAVDSARVQQYREKHQIQGEPTLPLLIQRMIPALVSGVLFTVDPISGERETIIEAVPGLGQTLVSGEITPHRYRVTGDAEVRAEAEPGNPVLTPPQCRRLADLGREVEALLGAPQDVEWALHENQFHLLQARPVTSYRFRPVAASMVWTRANIGEVLPGVITPLTWSVFRRGLLNRPLAAVDGPNGHGRDDTSDEGVRLIAGRAYLRLDKMLSMFCWLPGVTPDVMRQVLGVDVPGRLAGSYSFPNSFSPAIWVRRAKFVLDVLSGVPFLTRQVNRFRSQHLPYLNLPPDRAAGTDAESLKHHIERSLTEVARCFQLHLVCTSYAIGVFGLLSALLQRWVPALFSDLLPALLIGQEGLQTAAQGLSLWRLAEQARRLPALEALLTQKLTWQDARKEFSVTEGGREFLSELEQFLKHNGARAVGEFELRTPRWRENPDFVLVVLRSYLRNLRHGGTDDHSDSRQRSRMDAIAAAETHLKWWQKMLFRQLLHSYSICVTLRENMKYSLMEGYYTLRELFLALGKIVRARGIIENVDDVFFLTATEAITLACGHGVPTAATRRCVRERRTAHALWEQEDAASCVIGQGGTPISPAEKAPLEFTLKGIACSPGRAQGRARVLEAISLAGEMEPGEVLIAPSTDPGWTPLFLTAAGVVTEIGGFLSHGATVAREYGVPAVVGVSRACARIKTGDLITVDGDAGTVLIHRKATIT